MLFIAQSDYTDFFSIGWEDGRNNVKKLYKVKENKELSKIVERNNKLYKEYLRGYWLGNMFR